MAKTKPFDVAEYLDDPKMIAAYLSEALETGDTDYVKKAIGTVARAHGMASVAKATELSRENLYRTLSSDGVRTEFDTIMKVIDALGLQLEVKPKAVA